MAYSNCCNCSGNCGSMYGTGYARRNNDSCSRNSFAALNTVPAYTRYRNYPFYTGNCPNRCGCYECGCTAGVTNQNNRGWFSNSNCCSSRESSGCNDSMNCNTCDYCNNCGCNHCGICNNGNCNSGNCCDNCSPCCNNNCGCYDCCDRPVYGLYNANVPFSVTAGAAVPLVSTAISDSDFSVSGGIVTINRCGTYLATYTVNIPTGTEIDTNFILNVNGIAQPGTLLNVASAGSYTGQTVFTANAGTTLSIVSSAAAAIPDPVGQNVATLTLIKID